MNQRNMGSVHAGKSTVYHLDKTLDELTDRYPWLQRIGTVTVTGVNYIIEADGELKFRITTDVPRYVGQKDLSDYGYDFPMDEVRILISIPEIHTGDVFDIYSITDPYLSYDLAEKYGCDQPERNVTFFYWKLKGRIWQKTEGPLINLEHPPADCPFCGFPLKHSANALKKMSGHRVYCANPDCDIFRLRDFSRFLNFCLRAPGRYMSLVATCIRLGALNQVSDLYLPETRQMVYQVVKGEEANIKHVGGLFDLVDSRVGKVRFSDYILSLPFTRHIACVDFPPIVGSRYMCPGNIDMKFGSDPMLFVELIQRVTDDFMLSEDYSLFKNRVSHSVAPYMSFPVYHELAQFLTPVDSSTNVMRSYVPTISELSALEIFQQ